MQYMDRRGKGEGKKGIEEVSEAYRFDYIRIFRKQKSGENEEVVVTVMPTHVM